MRIYAIYNVPHQTFVKWGVNGGGKESYCLWRGEPCFFTSKMAARQAIQSFGIPSHYKIRTFNELEV